LNKSNNSLNKAFNNQNKNTIKNNENIIINSFHDKDKLSNIDLENRINKINSKMNSIVKHSINPSTNFDTELAS